MSKSANSSAVQRARLLAYLKIAGSTGITTIEAREKLDIMAPAPRIYELRHTDGHNIQTLWTVEENAQGNQHRNARYVLFPGKYQEEFSSDEHGNNTPISCGF